MVDITETEGLGGLLKQLRHERLLRLQDVAGPAGVADSTLSRVERGLVEARWSLFQRALAALDLQARVVVERRYVDIDGEIDRMLARSPEERLGDELGNVATVAAALREHAVRFALAGATAAVVLGVPLPLRRLQVAVAADDLEAVPTAMRSCRARPALPLGDPLRWVGAGELLRQRPVTPWQLLLGELELAVTATSVVERATPVQLGAAMEVAVPVLPLDALIVDDPVLLRTLDRFRARRPVAFPP
jgi:transcriptional regulator with XRE-family HTH domain